MGASYQQCDIRTGKHSICDLLLFLACERTIAHCGLFLLNYLRGNYAACFHYFIEFIIPCPREETPHGI